MKPLLIAILLASNGNADGQDLGHAAAKEKEKQRRAKVASSPKAYTEEDLRAAAEKRAKEGEQSLGPATPAAPSSAGSSPAGPKPEDPGVPEADDPQAVKKARGAEYKARLDVVNANLARAEAALKAAEKDWHLVQTHPWMLAGAEPRVKERLTAARKRVETFRAQRDEIEEAARREAIPPGYLR